MTVAKKMLQFYIVQGLEQGINDLTKCSWLAILARFADNNKPTCLMIL